MKDDFSDAPVSIGEIRSERERDAAKWTPRDALVSLLREIDSGEVKSTAVVVLMRVEYDDGSTAVRYVVATPSGDTTLALIEKAKHQIIKDMER